MKFLIATPVFNGMPLLPQCVGSVRGQVLPQAEAFVDGCRLSVVGDSQRTYQQINPSTSTICVQHIVQDGGSTDGSVEFLEKLDAEVGDQKSDDNNYCLSWSSASDGGMYDAINRAWARMDGDILSWLNADEQYLPGTLAKVGEYLDNHPEVDVVFGDFIIIDEQDTPVACRREIPLRKTYVVNGTNLYAASCTTFFRRRLFDRGLLKLDTSYRYAADAELIIRLLDNGVRFAHYPEYLSMFRSRPGGNLSCSQQMTFEMDEIQKKYGQLKSQLVRTGIRYLRYTERLLRGKYRKDHLAVALAMNEKPEYKRMHVEGVGFRFKICRENTPKKDVSND